MPSSTVSHLVSEGQSQPASTVPIMAALPPSRLSGSIGSSSSANSHKGIRRSPSSCVTEDSVPVETLVEHLLAAKRSLSTMTLLLRANDITQLARQAHEETVVISARSEFLRRGMLDQIRLLLRVRNSLSRSYEGAKREFGYIVRNMDAADDKLNRTMQILRDTIVESSFRPRGEEPRNLMDFVDENSIDDIREALKESIGELQATQQSFDGDLLRFENDIRALKKCLSPNSNSPSDSISAQQPIPYLLASLIDHSHTMAELLSSLTKHFDLCVTAVRSTEGGTELARLKAAETDLSQHSASAESVSISGIIAAQEQAPEIETLTVSDRAEMLNVVVADSAEVDEVVAELGERLGAMEEEFSILLAQAEQTKTAHASYINAYRLLVEVGSKLGSYVQSETEFLDRWSNEKIAIGDKLQEMEELKSFYESYANAYDNLILEAERRRVLDEKIHNIWRKAKESVDKLFESDTRAREVFKLEVGDHLPTDLWPEMGGPIKRWTVVPQSEDEKTPEEDMSMLDRSVVKGARERLINRRTSLKV